MYDIETADYQLPAANYLLVLFLSTLVLTALMHGAVEPWSIALFELLTAILLVFWIVGMVRRRRISIIIPSAAWPVIVFISFGLIQSISYTTADGRRLSLSMDVEATRGAVLALIFILISCIIGVNCFCSLNRLRVLAAFFTIYGLAMAVFALVQYFTWEGFLFWFRPTDLAVFGPFVNHNHFAGYMELLIPIPVAMVITKSVRMELRLLYGFSAVMMGIAIVVSLSRGGMISLAAGLIFIGLASIGAVKSRRHSHSRKDDEDDYQAPGDGDRHSSILKLLTVIAIAIAIIAGVFWIGVDPVLDRLARTADEFSKAEGGQYVGTRSILWSDTRAMIRANPLVGTGLGSFEAVYPNYSSFNGSAIARQAHNDFLQLAADTGVIGCIIGLWLLIVVYQAVARWRRRGNRLTRGWALGIGAGITSILVHSIFDFNLQIPSNVLLFLMMAFIATGSLKSEHTEAAGRGSGK